jgi:hypothetical protein
LSAPVLPFILLASVTYWYVLLRILHMEELYALAAKAREVSHSGSSERVFLIAEVTEHSRRISYRFYFSRETRPVSH